MQKNSINDDARYAQAYRLTTEQEFRLVTIKNDLELVASGKNTAETLENLKELFLQQTYQTMIKDNLIRYFMKNFA